jgi:NAD(P)-dependent dehydrogenase (short-subunit alcohol dehydrogenase family)
MRFDGRHAIVTGGASGIGAAVASRLAADGAAVTIFDLAFDDRGQTRPDSVVPAICDVASEDAVVREVAAAGERTGPIDILVNCAGIVEKTVAVETELRSWERVLAVNLTGAFLMTREVTRAMLSGGRTGSVVSIASVDAHAADAHELSYSASKAGLLGMTRGFAVELGAAGIRVNTVSPGYVLTPMALRGGAKDARAQALLRGGFQRVPLRRAVTPDEVAGVCAFLASDDATGVTGQDIIVDSGLLADAYLVAGLQAEVAALQGVKH